MAPVLCFAVCTCFWGHPDRVTHMATPLWVYAVFKILATMDPYVKHTVNSRSAHTGVWFEAKANLPCVFSSPKLLFDVFTQCEDP